MDGMKLALERLEDPALLGCHGECLACGQGFEIKAVLIVVRAGAECLGVIGPCCLDLDARRRYEAASREFAIR